MFLLAIIPILIVIGILGYLIYMGFFLPIEIEEKMIEPILFLYKEIDGKDFSLVGKVTTEIANTLEKHNISNRKPIQLFYPDDENKLAEIGFIVEKKREDIEGLKLKEIPATICLTTNFPWRNSYSFIFGFMKVDPALKKYRNSKQFIKTEAIVILENDSIKYLQPVRK